MRLPSKASLSRMRGRVDVAWMLKFRSLLQYMMDNGGVTIYPMVDPSPQGGRDYEMVVMSVIASRDLVQLHVYVKELESRCYL